MRKKIIICGDNIDRKWINDHFFSMPYETIILEDYTIINDFAQSMEDRSANLAIISIQKGGSLDLETAIQRTAKTMGIPYLRLAFEHNKCLIGPLVFQDDVGCVQCLESRMKNVHPNKKNWGIAYRDTSNNHPTPLPWNIPFLENVVALIHHELKRLEHGLHTQLKQAVYVGYSDTLRGKIHSFQPDPLCSECNFIPEDSAELADIKFQPRIKKNAKDYRLENPKLNLAQLKHQFYDWRAGLFNHIYRDPLSPLIPFSVAEMPLQNELTQETGIGRTTTYYDSEMVAILEGLERYAGMHPRGKKTNLRGSYNMFQEEAIHPRKLHIHEDEQQNEKGFNYVPYHDDLEMNWIWAYSWKKQKSVLVPEQLVYYRIIAPKEEPVHRFCYETSNGCALGGTLEEAIFYGLLEVVERDAFLVSWYNRLPLKRLNLELVEDKNILLVKDRIESMGYELYVFDMTMGTKIPAIWAMIVNPKEDAPVKCYSAAGAHPNPEKAIFSALVEVITSVPIYEKSMPEHRSKAEELYRDGGLVQEMHDHVLLYSLPKSIERFDFLLQKEKTIGVQEAFSSWYQGEPPLDFTEEVSALMKTILNEAEDILIVDQTTPELEKIDVKAIKVIVQGMLTMSFGHQYRRINKQRVKKAPVTVGYREQEIKDHEINMYPHPFP